MAGQEFIDRVDLTDPVLIPFEFRANTLVGI